MVIVVDLIGDEKRELLAGDGRYETVDNSSREGKPIPRIPLSPRGEGRKEERHRIRILVSPLSTPSPLTYDDV